MTVGRPRRARLILTISVSTVVLAGCGGSSSGGGSAAAQDFGLSQPGTVSVAITALDPYINVKNGQLTGLDGDLFNKAAQDLNLTVNVVTLDFAGLLAGVQSHRFDIGIGDIAWRKARADKGIFTDPPYYSPIILAEKPGLNATTLQAMAGHTMATVNAFFYIPGLQKIPNTQLRTYPTSQAVLADLDAGRVDVAWLDPLSVLYEHKQQPNLKFDTVVLEPPSTTDVAAQSDFSLFEPFMTGWYMPASETKFEAALNTEIRKFYASGFESDTVKKYGGDPTQMLVPIPDYATQRTSADRQPGWTPPAVSG